MTPQARRRPNRRRRLGGAQIALVVAVVIAVPVIALALTRIADDDTPRSADLAEDPGERRSITSPSELPNRKPTSNPSTNTPPTSSM